MKYFIAILFLLVLKTVQATDPYPRNDAIDIRHYQFRIALNDTTNRIACESTIEIRFKKSVSDFELDLVGLDAQGNGMTVSEILVNNEPVQFSHQKDRLKIILSGSVPATEERKVIIRYGGIPQDGMIISRNKFGDRTFFGDNWPNRAHHWLPTIDHPYDKATCEFIVTAPEKYTVIGTGVKLEESAVGKNQKLTHWKTTVILPTKVMTIGVARFAIEYEGDVDHIPLQSWVYPQNRAEGFADFAMAAKPLEYFHKNIAPYPYEKLANVQSTTRWGGIENAGNIFYAEKSVTGKKNIEGLLAHEIAHQWFGDSASEADWYHVWLSEGFATYFTQLYFENTYGSQRLMDEMTTDRKQVTDYFIKNPTPIVNTKITEIDKVLSINSYQKASWVLHMLRHDIGDQKFWEGIRDYYQQFRLGNALTDDFRAVMEKASGKDLKPFFDQWIFRPGHPKLDVRWTYDSKQKKVRLTVSQLQEQLFSFPLEFGWLGLQGQSQVEKVSISARKHEFSLAVPTKPSGISLDPNVWLLFEGQAKEGAK